MKKILTLLMLLTLCLFAFFACNEGDNPPPHTHEYGEWAETLAPTHSAQGEETRTCACGAQETRPLAQLEPTPVTGISFAGATYTYDGTAKSLAITGTLPEGVTVTYEGNGQTNAGNHTVTAKFTDTTGKYVVPADMTATLSIQKAYVEGIGFAGATVAYDGTPKSLAITGTLPDGVTVTYTGNGKIELGIYTVTAAFADTTGNYIVPVNMTSVLIIEKAMIAGIFFTDATYTYDGTAKSLAITGTLPTGVNVTYTGNGKVNHGTYTVTARFTDTTGNYIVPADMTAMLTIVKDGSYHTVTFQNESGNTISYFAVANNTVLSPTQMPSIPQKNGYTAAWDYADTPITADTVITPIYTIQTYTLTFDLAGGATTDDIPATYTILGVTLPTPTRAYYTFDGWYNDTAKVTTLQGLTGNLMLTAKWNSHFALNGSTITGFSSLGRNYGYTTLEIPNEINGVSVTGIGSSAFYGCSSLTSITIPDSVTTIGEYAFGHCSSLTSITIPDSVTTIGKYVFSGCSSLTSVTFGENSKLTTIGKCVFSGCSSLTSITIPDSVTTIGEYAFEHCSNLTSVTFGENSKLTTVGEDAFYDCSSLTSITIPSSVTTIGSSAFSGCSKLTSITIPASVTTIDSNAFSRCSSLTSITIPSSVTTIGNWAFDNCTSLTSVTFGENSKLTTVGYEAFYGCSSLTSVTFGENSQLTSIGSRAFYDCSSLTSITIPDSVTSICDDAFYDCDNLTAVTFGENSKLTTIGSSAFSSCSKLTSITIPASVTTIDSNAFSRCSSLTSITIPSSVTTIGSSAFSGCSKLTSITIPDSVTTIGECAFSICSKLTSITIPDSVTSIGERAFYWCSSLESIVVASGNTKYHSNGNCLIETATKTLILGCKNSVIPADGSVTTIGERAFSYCGSLTSVTIPDSVTAIGEYAFSDCYSLTSITIPDSVTAIGEYAFSDCYSLTSITIPNSVTSIGSYAFYNCRNLMSVTFGENSQLTSIGYKAFDECSSLTTITIPDSVTAIGYYAFRGCSSLTSVTFENPNGWWYSTSSTATSGYSISATDLANTTTAATYLTSDYTWHDWKRS